MANEKHQRFIWAIEILNVKHDDHILEIGCGVGLAVEEVAQYLTKGKITAIDKSSAMIEKAIRRNKNNIESKKARFVKTELLRFAEREVRYNKIFCFNVNLFWTLDSIIEEVSILKSNLSKGGLIYLFYGPMFGDGFDKIEPSVCKNLEKEKIKLLKIAQNERLKCCCFIATVL